MIIDDASRKRDAIVRYGVLDNFKVVVRRVVLPPNEWFWELAVGFTPDGPSEWRRMDLNDECDRDALGCIMPMSQWGSTDGPA